MYIYKKVPSQMLAWVLNMRLLLEDSLTFYFLRVFLWCKILEICYFFKVLYFP